MIRGNKAKKPMSADEILAATNGGYDIFIHYLGKVARLMSRPWGKKERHPSWGVYPYGGIWWWKDQANEESGDALQFVKRFFNITFKEAKDKVMWDFGLGGTEVNKNPVIILPSAPEEDKKYIPISFTSKPFTQKHHDFWNIAEVSEEHCNKMDCYAVKDLAINRKKVDIKDEMVFAYYCKEEDGVKIYFPERDKGERFRNNVSFHHLWNYDNVKECDDLIIQKSFKDLIVTTMITPCCIATQAEAVKIFNEDTVNRINLISKSPWIWYGSDWDGVKKCKEITDTNKWKYINTPKNLLPEVNDTYGYASKFKLKGLEDFMRSKKLLK